MLVVEGDARLSDAIARGLNEHRFDVVTARTFDEARERALFAAHDVIELDVMIPGGNGFELLLAGMGARHHDDTAQAASV